MYLLTKSIHLYIKYESEKIYLLLNFYYNIALN
jgi:hypothetical protein